jgi:RNA polymerase sigma-70 factor (ECF subfamily)
MPGIRASRRKRTDVGSRTERMPRAAVEQPTQQIDFAAATRPLLGSLVAAARRILRDEDAAWDAVQEALISLWRESEMPLNVRSWLLRTVAHRSLHLARCRSRRLEHEREAGLARGEESDRDDPARRLEGEELGCIMEKALCRIAPDHHAVLVKSVIEQMDYESIAMSLQIPIGTVRSRMNRARRSLREVLIHNLPDEYLIRPHSRPEST